MYSLRWESVRVNITDKSALEAVVTVKEIAAIKGKPGTLYQDTGR